MGQGASKYSDNDFELAIRAAKDLEYILESEFEATGKGLHEKVTSASLTGRLPTPLIKKMRYLASLRNKLVHERGFDRIPDRELFIVRFEESTQELEAIVMANKGGDKPNRICVIC